MRTSQPPERTGMRDIVNVMATRLIVALPSRLLVVS